MPIGLDQQFLTQIRIPLSLRTDASGCVVGLKPHDLGPLLQGALMECIDSGYAGLLHSMPFNPYSQCCECEGGGDSLVWVVNTLTNDSYDAIVKPLFENLDSLRLKKLNAPLGCGAPVQRRVSRRELVDAVSADCPSAFSLRFTTPASFKSHGAYQIIPSTHFIYQNLLMHYGQVFDGSNEADVETVAYLAEHTRITRYRLHSQPFALAGKRIPAFMGSLTVRVSGVPTLRGFAHMLFRFGEFSGIGIKTSMGMGGLHLE